MEGNACERIESVKDPVLSIIIPAYNVADYLPGCVSSILRQKRAPHLEILIVDDGSSDNTVEIAKALMDRYNLSENPIIRLISKKNGGHGSTINVGTANVRGKYFKIVDADDWLGSDSLEKLVDCLLDSDSDIVVSDYTEDWSEGLEKLVEPYQNLIPGIVYHFDDLADRNYGFKSWGPILRTGCFKTEMYRNVGAHISESCSYVDVEFDMYCIVNADTVEYCPGDVYHYYLGREGQSTSHESYKRKHKEHEKVTFNVIDYYLQHEDLSEQKKSYLRRRIVNSQLGLHYILLIEWLADPDAFIKFDRRLAKYPYFYERPGAYDMPKKMVPLLKFHRRTGGRFLKHPAVSLRGSALLEKAKMGLKRK